jgi:hypothetical protein
MDQPVGRVARRKPGTGESGRQEPEGSSPYRTGVPKTRGGPLAELVVLPRHAHNRSPGSDGPADRRRHPVAPDGKHLSQRLAFLFKCVLHNPERPGSHSMERLQLRDWHAIQITQLGVPSTDKCPSRWRANPLRQFHRLIRHGRILRITGCRVGGTVDRRPGTGARRSRRSRPSAVTLIPRRCQ